MPRLHLLCIPLLACTLALAQQSQPGGLSPKAGAVSENLYTNLFFGFNFRFPQKWDVSFVASEGDCKPECMLLDVRAPEYPKPPRMINISVEPVPGGNQYLPSAALAIQQSGGKPLAPMKETEIAGHELFRVEYRSQLASGDLYQAFLTMPDKNYLVVFYLTGESRKELDAMADDVAKALTFTSKS